MSSTTDESDSELVRAKDRNELFRSRARSAAALTGAGAGALAAGLVLTPSGENLSAFGRLFGLVSVVLLILGTSLFVKASLMYSEDDAETNPTVSHLQTVANNLFSSIKKTMKWAKWVSAVSVSALVVSLGLLAFSPPTNTAVIVRLVDDALPFPGCEVAPRTFSGVVAERELASTAQFIVVQIPKGLCGDGGARSFVVDRSKASISVEN